MTTKSPAAHSWAPHLMLAISILAIMWMDAHPRNIRYANVLTIDHAHFDEIVRTSKNFPPPRLD